MAEQTNVVSFPDPPATSDTAKAPGGGQESNRRVLKAIVIGPRVKENLTTGQTKEIPQDDLLDTLVQADRLVPPPFDKLTLAMLPEHSTELGQVIEAMVTNIAGFGYRLSCRVRVDDPTCPPELKKLVLAERIKLTNFFSSCTLDYSFTELRRRTRKDQETTGEAFWEVIRVPGTNEIVQLNHLPSHQIWLGTQDKEFARFSRKVATLQPDGAVTLENRPFLKRFRRFVQARVSGMSTTMGASRGYDVRWFKEFGDSRTIDNGTGEIVPPDQLEGFPEERKAGELIHWKLYSSRSSYGMPRFIGNLITIFGDRAADEVNYTTLKNNNIPSIMLMVSNGQLTEGTIKRIQEFVERQIAGSDNYSRFLIVEAEGQFEGPDVGHIKMEAKPLTSEQMRDQLFQEYGKNNREKIRECFRLPPIFVGRAEDYTRATAEASRRLADEQIFRPERDEEDAGINRLLLAEMGVVFHEFKSNGPNVTDDEDLINVITASERSGAMTPALARRIIADILSAQEDTLPPLEGTDPNVPFSLQLAEAVKNQAAPEAQLAVKSAFGLDPLASILDFRVRLEKELARKLDR